MSMDDSRLKGRPPFPFTVIAAAIAFSPRLEAMVAESVRLAAIFGAGLLLIHVGSRTAAKEALLEEVCGRLGGGSPVRTLWLEGDAVESLLAACKENMVDLLILGALRRENLLRYYLGSVARRMSRRAKCSLLLLIDPSVTGTPFRRIVVGCVDHGKTAQTVETVGYLAAGTGCTDLRLVWEMDPAGLAMSMSDDRTTGESARIREQLLGDEEAKLRRLGGGLEESGFQVERRVLSGRPGFAIRRYAEECGADLLAVNSPDGRYGIIDRIFTHGMEHILEHLPCNILIVHSRPAVGTEVRWTDG
jgi:nucleotide-binding universal stress UspA family protein